MFCLELKLYFDFWRVKSDNDIRNHIISCGFKNIIDIKTFYWDGKDKYLNEVSNGTYFYHLLAKNDSENKFEYISKLTKIK